MPVTVLGVQQLVGSILITLHGSHRRFLRQHTRRQAAATTTTTTTTMAVNTRTQPQLGR